jgi:hypothetical protein
MNAHEHLFTVRLYAFAHWRYAIGHPRAGEVSRVEMYERVGASVDYCLHRPTGTIRRFG